MLENKKFYCFFCFFSLFLFFSAEGLGDWIREELVVSVFI